MMLPKRLSRSLSVTAVAAVLAGTGVIGAVPAGAATAPTVLRVGLAQDVDSLNPFLAEFASSTDIGRAMYEFLTTYSPKNEAPVPGLATRWTHTPDGRTWTYTIRRGALWSDGTPITARDVAFTFHLMMTNPVAATANGNFVANFASVAAPKDTTVVITTKQPQATMLALDVPIVPEHIWSHVTDIGHYTNLPAPGHPVVGSGPFVLTDYREGQFVKLAANRHYWRGTPKVDQLDFVHFDNTDAEVQALVKGDIDLANGLSAAQFGTLARTRNVTVNKAEGGRFVDLAMNTGAATNTGTPIGDGNPVLRDVAVRTAIADAVNPATLVRQVYGGDAQVAGGYIPDKFATYHWNPPAGQAHTFDPARANHLLDADGYRRGADGTRVDQHGQPLRLRLIGRDDQPQQAQMAAYVKSWLGAVGIPVDVQLVSSNKLDDVTSAGDFDLAFSGWGVDPDPDAVLAVQTCDHRPDAHGENNDSEVLFCDHTYDTLYLRQRSDLNPATRVADVKHLESVFYQQASEVTLLYPNVLEAYRSDRFAPFQVQPDPGGAIMAQNGYWGYLSATPITTTTGGRTNTGLIVGTGIAVLVIIGVFVVFGVRRRGSAADRE
ncbi:MAG TPA: peptide ABC transporter substrate-binding protein [Pseudonocardiaceae bacterium]